MSPPLYLLLSSPAGYQLWAPNLSGHPALAPSPASPEDVCPANQFPPSSPFNKAFLGLRPKELKWDAKFTKPQTRSGSRTSGHLTHFLNNSYFGEIIVGRVWASTPTRAAGPRDGRDTWPPTPGAPAARARPQPVPATNGRFRPQPYGGTEIAHLGWEGRTQASSSTPADPEAGTPRQATALPQQLSHCLHRNRNRRLEVTPSRRSAERRNPPTAFPSHPGVSQQARPPSGGKSSSPSFRLSLPRSVTLMDIQSLQSTDKVIASGQ